MAELFQKDVRTVNEHIQNIFEGGNLCRGQSRILNNLNSCRAAPGQAVLVRRAATFMNRNWTPESRVSVTDAGMVIEIELGAVQTGDLEIFVEADQLCVRGRHDDFGPFETRFGLTPNHNLMDAKATFTKGILRLEVPVKDNSFRSKLREMMIYCNGCGKHFDIVVTSKGSRDYRCPACGKVQVFDLEAFVKKAIEQGKKMLKKKRDRR